MNLRKLAYGLSAVYHPLLMTTFLMALMLFYAPTLIGRLPDTTKWILLGLILLLTYVLPMINIFMLKFTGTISNVSMKIRKERLLPLIFTAVYYGFSTYILAFHFRVSSPIIALLAGVFGTLVLVTIITFFYKISIHAAGSWGGVGMFIALMHESAAIELFWPLIVVILLAGTVSTARLYLNEHTLPQILYGALVGIIACFTSIYLIL